MAGLDVDVQDLMNKHDMKIAVTGRVGFIGSAEISNILVNASFLALTIFSI